MTILAAVAAPLSYVYFSILNAESPPGTRASSISYGQYAEVRLGETQSVLERELGLPEVGMLTPDTPPPLPPGSACMYYMDSGPAMMDAPYYGFCFDSGGRLIYKNNYGG